MTANRPLYIINAASSEPEPVPTFTGQPLFSDGAEPLPNSPASPLSESIPRIAMGEFVNGQYWVLLNFPGRSSVTLTTEADRELAIAITEAARLVARECLAYADSFQTKGGREASPEPLAGERSLRPVLVAGQDAPPFPNCDCGRPVIRGCTGCGMHPLDCGCPPVGDTSPATQGSAQ